MDKIWIERPLPPAYLNMFEGVAEPIGAGDAPSDAVIDTMQGATGIIASARMQFDGALMDKVPTLRVISRTGIGYDNISVPDATARGIAVCNAPDAPSTSTSEHAITLMLAVTKQIKRAEANLHRGGKQDFFADHDGIELAGLRLGLIGLGRIGSRVAKISLALGMFVSGYDPALTPKVARMAVTSGIELTTSLEQVLRTADVLSLHAPLTADTRHLMNAERIAMMKPGAFLINTARGGLVDEAALIQALDSGHLGGAGLDVFDPEPPLPDNPLLFRDNVIATPHIASATGASKNRLWRMAIEQALQVLRGEQPPNLVNPDVWPNLRQG